MTTILGGPIGPNGVGGAYANSVETDRAAVWWGGGGWQGIHGSPHGFAHSAVAGQMALSFAKGAATVSERDALGEWQERGYHVYSDTDIEITFGPASVAARNDALVIAVVDTEDGAVGTGALDVGPHIVVVPGASGVTTPVTATDITAYLGRGGWIRYLDVPIASTDTEINLANVAVAPDVFLNDWNDMSDLLVPATNVSISRARYKRIVPGTFEIDLAFVWGGTQIDASSVGNFNDQPVIESGVPAFLWPRDGVTVYDRFVRNGVAAGSWRISPVDGGMDITDMYSNATISTGTTVTCRMVYSI